MTQDPEIRDKQPYRHAWSRDMLTAGLGVWLVAAVFADGWAHVNVPELESFFTPWHLALYAGFATTTVWLGLLAWHGRLPGIPATRWLPYGYRGAALGVLIFGIGGIADLAWHEVFGIEVAVDALVSPSHLVLGAGGMLILTSGLRAQRVLSHRHAGTWNLPALLSLVLSTALAAFFLLYMSPFPLSAPVDAFVPTPEGTPGHEAAEVPVIAALAGYLVHTVLITVPFLLMLRSHAGLPRGGVTLLVGTVAWLSVAVVDFPANAVAGAIGATIGAVTADFSLAVFTPRLPRAGLPLLAAAGTAVLVWSGQLAGLAVGDAIRWPASLWLGLVVLSGFTAAALGALVAPSPQ